MKRFVMGSLLMAAGMNAVAADCVLHFQDLEKALSSDRIAKFDLRERAAKKGYALEFEFTENRLVDGDLVVTDVFKFDADYADRHEYWPRNSYIQEECTDRVGLLDALFNFKYDSSHVGICETARSWREVDGNVMLSKFMGGELRDIGAVRVSGDSSKVDEKAFERYPTGTENLNYQVARSLIGNLPRCKSN